MPVRIRITHLISKSDLRVLLVLLIIGFLIRIPSIFWIGSVGWDEDAFFTMAQSNFIFHQLPYSDVLINPPPFTYLYYFPGTLLGGDSLPLYRFVAYLYLVISAFLLTSIKVFRLTALQRIFIGTLFIGIFSLLPEGSGWLTELNSCLALTILLVVVSKRKDSTFFYLVLGVTISITVLTRTNLAFSVVGIIATYSFRTLRHKPRQFLALVSGGVFPVFLIVIVYGLSGKLSLLLDVVIKLPLAFMTNKDAFHLEIGKSITLLVAIPLCFALISYWRGGYSKLNFDFLLIFLGTLLSVLLDQPNYGHHLLQLSPFAPLFLGILITQFNTDDFARRFGARFEISFFSVLSILIVATVFLLSQPAFKAKEDSVDFQEKFKALVGKQDTTLWAVNGTELYYRLSLRPVSPLVAHPNNVVDVTLRNTIFDGLTESEAVRSILSLDPEFIVISEPWYLAESSLDILDGAIQDDYILISSDARSGLNLFQLRNS